MSRDERAKACAPTIPPETCPTVDRLSTRLSAIDGDLETFLEGLYFSKRKTVDKADVRELLAEASANLASARLIAEELRNANDQLRESGRYWRGVAKGASDQLDALETVLEKNLGLLPLAVAHTFQRMRASA